MTAAASGDHSLGDDFLDRIDQMRENLRRFPIETLPDPTLGWSRDPKADLILNLDDSTFSDIKIGDPCAALSFLGRCDKFTPTVFNCVDTHGHRLDDPKVIYTLGYHSDGLGFSADKSFRIESFLVYLQPNPDEIGSKSYTGKVFWNGKAVDRVLLRNMDSFINTFGFPDEDNEEPEHDHPLPELGREPYRRNMIYKKPSAMWMIEVDKSGHTQGIFLSGAVGRRYSSQAG